MSLDDRIQAYIRATATAGREVVSLDGLVATFHPRDPLRFLNYAIPGAGPWDLAGLLAASRARDRLPRLEFVESCAPGLVAEVEAFGFTREARLDLMTCTPETLRWPRAPAHFELVRPGSPLVGSLLTAQRRAFQAAGEVTERDVSGFSATGLLAQVDGVVAGGGVFTPLRDGLCELAGIGVLSAFRRRGIGAGLTAELSALAFARGADLAFLTPGDDDTRRIYERAGFAATSTMLAYTYEES